MMFVLKTPGDEFRVVQKLGQKDVTVNVCFAK